MRILIAASPGAGWTGRIATAPKPRAEMGEARGERVRPVNQRQAPLRPQEIGGAGDPALQAVGGKLVRCGAQQHPANGGRAPPPGTAGW